MTARDLRLASLEYLTLMRGRGAPEQEQVGITGLASYLLTVFRKDLDCDGVHESAMLAEIGRQETPQED